MHLPRHRRLVAGAGALAAAAGTALALAASGVALPPGGVADQPGAPAGSLTVTTPEVPQKGAVGFCVQNQRVDTAGGPEAQPFMLKFDDHGSYGIGPFTPAADGSLCATVSTDPAAYTTAKGGAADKIPDDLCDPAKEHWLRLLSGAWAHPDGTQRSIAAGFRVTGACGSGGGTGGGGTGTGTTPTGTTPTTTTPAPGGTATAPARVRSTTTAAGGRALLVKLTAGSAFVRGSVLVRSRGKLRVGRSSAARRTLARGSFQLAAGDTLTLRLPLSADARSLLRTRATVAAALTLTPRDAAATTTNVTLRRARAA